MATPAMHTLMVRMLLILPLREAMLSGMVTLQDRLSHIPAESPWTERGRECAVTDLSNLLAPSLFR